MRIDRFIILLCCLFSLSHAQGNLDREAEEHFQRGAALYRLGQSRHAARVLSEFIDTYEKHPRVTIATLLAARSWIEVAEPQRAVAAVLPILIRYPQSALIDDACLILGEAYAALSDTTRAIEALATGFPLCESDSLRDLYFSVGKQMIPEIGVTIPARRPSNEKQNELISVFIASLKSPRKQPVETEGESNPTERNRTVRTNKRERDFHLLVVLPKKGFDSERNAIVAEVAEGIKTAIGVHEQRKSIPMRVEYFFAEENSDSLARFISSLHAAKPISAIVGGIFTNDAFPLARIASELRIPLLVPTAMGNGIAAVGETIFQCNNDFEARGASMAVYAARKLHAQHVAVIAPLESSAKLHAEAFVETARALGMSVDAVSWYKLPSDGYQSQFASLKRNLFYQDSVDVLYLPVARTSDIPTIVEQLLRSKIRARVLGSGVWNDLSVLVSIPPSVNPIDFENDYDLDAGAKSYSDLKMRGNTVPPDQRSKHFVLGFDATDFLLATCAPSAITAEEVLTRLAQVQPYRALHGVISLDGRRVNGALHIMRYNGTSIQKIHDVDIRGEAHEIKLGR